MPFRSRYLTYDEMARTMRAWADAYPDFVRLESLGKSPEQRDYLLLVIGREPERVRPAVWVDGNMHATELCGSSVALAIAEDVVQLHAGHRTVRDLPEHVCDRLRDTLFYVLPRMCPDGAEAVLREGRYVRSNPRDTRHHAPVPRWKLGDVDGDGQVMVMRKQDPSGDYVEHPDMPGLLLPRRIEDTGPFYKVWPEGHIENFDGVTVPDPHFLSDNDTDMNRNFPWSWAPEHDQMGAGKFATSEPEARAVVEFATAHPSIFAWLNLHTFGGCHIRPLGHAPDSKMDPSDMALYNQLEAWGQEHTGYPTVSGFHDFLYEPDKPLHGDEVDFAYHQRGAFAYTTELWDLFAQLGIARKKPFTDHYRVLTQGDLLALARWDREKNSGRILRPWKKTTHPQLGEVEVGGMNGLVGISNPPYEMIADICERHSKLLLRVAALAPALRVAPARTTRLGEHGWRVEVSVENHGYLPTYVLSSAKQLSEDARVFASCEARGPKLLSDARVEVGHLAGWGHGLYDAGSSIFHQRSPGSGSRRVVTFTGEGHGVLQIRATGLRTGSAHATVEV